LSGHGGPPALLALAATADWHSGEVWALQLAWSGDHSLRVEPDREGGWYLTAGAGLNPGEIVLAPGEAFEAPGLFACFSTAGRNGVVAGFHERIRARVTWPGGARRPRPVHFNSWESVYFAHDEARMIQLARAAAELGVERFVVDDGWFAGRDGDDAGLGDWVPDPQRYPRGLGPLAREVTNLGMEFGLWIEPEMVNVNSDLYRAHPEWVLGSVLARPLPMARHQLVLDMARADVRDHLFAAITALLSELPVAYLKWDHNRALAPAVRADGAAGTYAHIRGVWELWDRVRAAFPDVEIEACAAGGGRIDAGFAARAHRFWASDNIDALSRVEIQRGFLQFMPPEMMGAHVGATPAHATGRPQAMDFSAMIALPGHFGIECDPGKLSDLERQRLRSWIAIYKSLRERFHHGRCWLGETPGGLVWQAHGSPQDLLLLVTRTAPAVHGREAPLRLPMLPSRGAVRAQLLEAAGLPRAHQPANLEILRGEGVIMPAGWIASHGLPLPHLGGMGAALFRLKSI
jgi:alpha-galactosidase